MSKTKVLEDLSSFKKRWLDLAKLTTKIKTSLNWISNKCTKLENELKQHNKKEKDLKSAKEQDGVALEEPEKEVATKLSEGKKISKEIPKVEVVAKEVEAT